MYDDRLYILAGNHAQYLDYIKSNHITLKTKYISKIQDVWGRSLIQVVLTGTWAMRADAFEILGYLRAHDAIYREAY